MNKISNEQALSFIDSFLGKVQSEKKAEDAPTMVKEKDMNGMNMAGTEQAKMDGTLDNSPEKTKKEEKPVEGATGKEKSADLAAGTVGVGVESKDAKNNVSKANDHIATGDFGAEPTNDGGKPSYVEVEKMKVAEETIMKNEMLRAEKLGNEILKKVAALQNPAPAEKPAEQVVQKTAEEQQLEGLLKTASDAAYQDFVVSYQIGLLKRAEDEAAIQQALGLTPKQAADILDEVAAENPEAVMPPEEGMPAEGAPDVAAEAAAEGEAPAAEEAEQIVQELIDAGIPPEEIEQAIASVDKAASEQVLIPKNAADRQAFLQDIITNFRAAHQKK